jgi:hypothetical protein
MIAFQKTKKIGLYQTKLLGLIEIQNDLFAIQCKFNSLQILLEYVLYIDRFLFLKSGLKNMSNF